MMRQRGRGEKQGSKREEGRSRREEAREVKGRGREEEQGSWGQKEDEQGIGMKGADEGGARGLSLLRDNRRTPYLYRLG